MIGLGACYLGGGGVLGGGVVHVPATKPAASVSPSAAVVPSIPAPVVSAGDAAAQLSNPLSKFSAKVASITDGDTVDLLAPGNLTYAVRLAGIDAPEHDQAFGAQSTQHLRQLITG